MGADNNGDFGFQEGGGSFLHRPPLGLHMASQPKKVAGATMSSMPLCKSSIGANSFFGTGWDPLVSLAENGEFKGSSMASHHSVAISPYNVAILENQGNSSTSHLFQNPSDPNLIELARKISCFGRGSFLKMVGSFGLPECNQIANAGCPFDYLSINEGGTEKNSSNSRKVFDHSAIFRDDVQISSEGFSGLSPNGKKMKRVPECHSSLTQSQLNSIQSAEAEQENDVSQETLEGPIEKGEKKRKTEKNSGGIPRVKLTIKQAKARSQNGQALKNDYIHVRAKRGLATNSHSLAERVRREKISQRMRFLQDLVPGCDKITGKTLMLDAIINYVQSLQQQVEFLSMKLATVNPGLNIDMEQILSKNIPHSRGGGSAILGFGPGMSSSHPHPHISPRGAEQAIQCTDSQIPLVLQMPNLWGDELQSVNQMGFTLNPALDSLGPKGHMKVEL